MTPKKLWLGFIAVMTISFAALIYYGIEIYREAPPIPDKVITADGTILSASEKDIVSKLLGLRSTTQQFRHFLRKKRYHYIRFNC